MFKKKICVFTSSRSEYSLLRNICKKFIKKKNLKLELYVTGSHFSNFYGRTVNEIKEDLLLNNLIVGDLLKVNSTKKINYLQYISKLKFHFSNYLNYSKPDIIVLLGDRFETLEVATLCYISSIIIIHIHGGEKTIGSKDDAIRHAISKLANFHFVSSQDYKKRLLQLGENKKNIFVVGPLSIENISKIKKINKPIEQIVKRKLKKKNFLVSYHPEGNDLKVIKKNVNILLKSLKFFKDTLIIFTAPSIDFGSNIVIEEIKKFCRNNKNSKYIKSLGGKNYLLTIKKFDLVIGNSSSGILEAPFLNTYTINIGRRQAGRVKTSSVIDVPNNSKIIIEMIKKYMNIKFYLKKNPYCTKNYNISSKILSFVNNINLKKEKKIIKNFYDNF